ncbi:MAG: ABC transporter ATP-binding protein [Ruminococcus sp.]
MSFLSVRNIVKKFDTHTALNDVSIEIEKGELVSILGPSGCGKTTLLRIIAGLETADGGQVFIDGRDCTSLPPSKRNFGIVFQSYALFPHMTVEQNILFGLNQQKQLSKEERKARCQEVLEMVDLYDQRKKYPSQMSGGQQQRVALARAISLKPAFLLLDEPLSALDAKVRVKLRSEICKIQKKLGITTIMVTHDQEEALTMADKIVVMNNAVVEQIGTPKEIYDFPRTAFVANFIGTMNLYERNHKIYGVRPEIIEITKAGKMQERESWSGKIEEVEFRGAMTRIYGKLDDTQETICADIDSAKAGSLVLNETDEVFFNIPKSGIICYPEEGMTERKAI